MTQQEMFEYLVPFGENGATIQEILRGNYCRYYYNARKYIAKVLSDGVHKGNFERIGRGVYRVAPNKLRASKQAKAETENQIKLLL